MTARLAVLVLILLVLGVPVTDFWRFLLLTTAVMAICFGQVRLQPRRWLIAIVVTVIVVTIDWLLPGPRIEEGHNVYIPVGANLEIFERELPPDAQRAMLAIFNRGYLEGNAPVPGSADWWQHPNFKKPGALTKEAFAPSADAIWQTPKYSRIVNAIKFRSQNQAGIDAINSKKFNFYDQTRRKNQRAPNFSNSARIDRAAMPFFVMFEISPSLVGGKVCWRGDVLWEQQAGRFAQQHNVDRSCQNIAEDDLGKRVFALAIAPEAPRDFAVYASLQQRAVLCIKLALRSLAVLALLGALIRIDDPVRLLLPIGAVLSTVLTFLIYWSDLPFGFHTHAGGNDGLTHESFGFGISQAAAQGDFQSAFRGGEDVFHYMPGLRYIRALEDFLFGSTSFGVVLCVMFIPIFLFFVLRHYLPLRWSIGLILVFMVIPIFQQFGFAQFLYVRLMWKGFAEPIGYGAFLGALALIAQQIAGRTPPVFNPTRTAAAWIGLALAVSMAIRPNLAVACILILTMLGLWLVMSKKRTALAFLALGFAPILLVPFHNWYFSGQFVPLSSQAFTPRTLITPPSTYIAAIEEVLHLDLAGDNLARVGRHLSSWNKLTDLYRLPILLVTVWVVLRPGYDVTLRGIGLIALSLQIALFFYVPDGRHANLAWLLVFIVFVVVLNKTLLPWILEHRKSGSAVLHRQVPEGP